MKRAWVALPALAALLGGCASAVAVARQDAPVPGTDIFLAPLSTSGDSLVVGRALNVTRRAGYDNQPSFTADSRSILYTAQHDGQTDIWRHQIGSQLVSQVTRTAESEYSATEMPGEARFSVIRVERDSTQRLWSFARDGSDPQLVLRQLRPVGYHLWLGPTQLVAFVLGSPPTLHLIARDESRDTIVAREVGRAIQSVPMRSMAFSFTTADSARRRWIWTTSAASRVSEDRAERRAFLSESPRVLVQALADNEYHTWTPSGVLLSASGSTVMRWNGIAGAGAAWLPVADLGADGVRSISRLVVSQDGRWIAFAAEPAAP